MALRAVARAFLVLGLPGLALIGGIPLFDRSHVMILGMPLVLAWVFAWMPGTTLCLWLGWYLFDRNNADEASS